MRKGITAGITAVLLIAFMLSVTGCGAAQKGNNSNPGQTKYEYTVSVLMDGKAIKSYNIDDIKKIPQKSIEVEGKTESGPALEGILADCGISGYSKVTLTGIAKDSLILAKDKIDADTLLDISNRGTVKLASKLVPKADWVKDITTIAVEK